MKLGKYTKRDIKEKDNNISGNDNNEENSIEALSSKNKKQFQ